MPAEKRAPIQDTYGCIKWEMKFMPLGETAESQQQSRDELKSLSKQNAPNQDVIKELTRSTFYTQRKKVNNRKEIKYLLEDWPFLFDEMGMAVHFEELTGVSLKETFVRNLDLKGERLLNYLKTVAVNKSKRLVQAFTKIQLMRREHTGPSDDVLEMVLLLLSYFDEKEDVMFTYMEDTCLAEEVQMDQVPLTPTIVVCGKLTMLLSHTRIHMPNSVSQTHPHPLSSHLFVVNCICFCRTIVLLGEEMDAECGLNDCTAQYHNIHTGPVSDVWQLLCLQYPLSSSPRIHAGVLTEVIFLSLNY